jgi:hypothetical protein
MVLLAAVVIVLFGSIIGSYLYDQTQMRKIAAMGGHSCVRDSFYEEWNPWRTGTPYRVIFSQANLNPSAMTELKGLIPGRWSPVIVEVRDCVVSSKGLADFSNQAVERIDVYNATWVDGPAWANGSRTATGSTPAIQIFTGPEGTPIPSPPNTP